MRPRRKTFNPKRRIDASADLEYLEELAKKVSYGGNPEHKRNPGNFGLAPPASPSPDKTLCDAADIHKRATALSLLRKGIRRGLVSVQTRGGFPQNVWSLTGDGKALEAQLENQERGAYHGYPMPSDDPFGEEVVTRWGRR